jgi:antitoxin component HigA of HigAB toxin-antitoxin module/mRNA-degrading endonuclease HigB of HigAB toxin-antitoxin module
MRILGAAALSLYIKERPDVRRHMVGLRALLASASWRRPKDVEAQFGHVATFDKPDRITFNFTDEDVCIEIRVNFALGLVLVVKPISKQERHEMTNEPIRPIRTEADYRAALAQIGELFNAETGTPEGDRLEVLSVLVADYERRRNVDVQADPVDVLTISMKGQGRTQTDLAELLESRSRASEVLSRRRQLSAAMIEKIAQAWSIPASLLQTPVSAETRWRGAFRLGAIVLALLLGGTAIATWGMFSFYGAGLPDTGQIAATFAGSRIRIPNFTPLDEISPEVVKAFLAAEDDHFYSHGAYSVSATIRAAFHVLISRKREGGSTITQQLAKNTFLSEEPSISRKIKEIVLGRRIEQALSKDRILEAYFNRTYFGGKQYGIAAASDYYFGKRPADLTVAEAASLAGLVRAPNVYRLDDPANFDRAKERRDGILRRMADGGWITITDARLASAEPLLPIGHN